MKTRLMLMAALIAGLSNASLPAAAQSFYTGKGNLLLTPAQLAWKDAPAVAPGARIAVIEGPLNKASPFTFRLELPANTKIAPHVHPAFERVTVLSGTLYLAPGDTYDAGNAQALAMGSVAIMAPGAPMFGYTKEATVIQLHGVGPWGIKYLHEAEDPRQR